MKEGKRLGRRLTEEEAKSLMDKMNRVGGSCLWIRESMFNHSCTANCTWSQIGDHKFVRTNRPVEPGEGLCIPYVGLDENFEKRSATFRNWVRPGVGFLCACSLCNLL